MMDEERKPDLSGLARDMLLWEQLRGQLEEIENRIRTAVLALGKTQTVGTVRASYSAGRKAYDYEGAAESYGRQDEAHYREVAALVSAHAKITCDFKAVCEDLKIEAPFTQSPPSVSVKIIA